MTCPRGKFVLPQPLRDYAGGDVGELRWRSFGGGVKHLPVDTGGSEAKARLLSIPARTAVPDHGHRGLELTLVLAGSFYNRGAWFRRGDVEEADATVEHQPVAGPEATCICLAVADAPLRFRGILPQLARHLPEQGLRTLIFVTPLYLLLLTVRTRDPMMLSAVILGCMAVPLAHLWSPDWGGVIVGGLAAGTLAFAVNEARRAW